MRLGRRGRNMHGRTHWEMRQSEVGAARKLAESPARKSTTRNRFDTVTTFQGFMLERNFFARG